MGFNWLLSHKGIISAIKHLSHKKQHRYNRACPINAIAD